MTTTNRLPLFHERLLWKLRQDPDFIERDVQASAQIITRTLGRHVVSAQPMGIVLVTNVIDDAHLFMCKIEESLFDAGLAQRNCWTDKIKSCGPTDYWKMSLLRECARPIGKRYSLFSSDSATAIPFSVHVVRLGQQAIPVMERVLQYERTEASSITQDYLRQEVLRQTPLPEIEMTDWCACLLRNPTHQALCDSGANYPDVAGALAQKYVEVWKLKDRDDLSEGHLNGLRQCFGGDQSLWRYWLTVSGTSLLRCEAVMPHLYGETVDA